MKKQLGISIIEVVVYMGLLTLMMGSGVLVLFQIVEGNSRREHIVLIQEEGQFMMEKMITSLPRGTIVKTPEVGAGGDVLTLIAPQTPLEPIVFYRDDSLLLIKRGMHAPRPLNTSGAPLTNLNFEYLAATDRVPAEIIITFSVDGEDFSRTHILEP